MRGVLIALARQRAGVATPAEINDYDDAMDVEVAAILDRVRSLDEKEVEAASAEIDEWLDFWRRYCPKDYGRMGGKPADTTLAYPFGGYPDEQFQREAWPIPTSMRNVDGTSEALVVNVYDTGQPDYEEA